MEYTPEQEKDIRSREQKGLDAIKELELTPAAQVVKVNVGNDVFADKVVPYLQDTRYAKKEDKPDSEAKEPVEAERA